MTDATLTGPIFGDDLWDVARQLYDAGLPAREICEDLGLATATFWRRARQDGWLRRDRRVEAPAPLDLEAPIQASSDAADKAWRRMTQALEAGRAMEALRWRRLHEALADGEARAASRTQREAREQLDRLSGAAKLIEAQAKAALRLRHAEEGERADDW
ncbi:MAG TPA: hypothetical protein VGR32_00745 [Brevundimonas sp.]|jgi:hypothetical protein|uniref:hypothetical protein n=1 Tax=Brevundimonas sp. TaxID=1871086 RepID=UPI002DEA16B4|nr:hypothetical protein [Brevundimonas sp.]